MILARRRIALAAVSTVVLVSSAAGFAPPAAVPHVSLSAATTATTSGTRLNVVPLQPDQITDYAVLLNHVAAAAAHTSSSLLTAADAATAAASNAAASQQPDGWWGAYINLFKTTLYALHSFIDQPLRSIGIDQTWGVTIGLFTAMARSLLLPLSIQQSKSSEYMKALKPYVAEIKEKFKNNQDAQNRAVGKLYEDAKQNPLSGCLVSLAQIPIFLGLYRGIRYLALDNVLDEPFLFIPSLEGPVSPPDFRGMDWLLTGWTSIDGTLTPQLGWETTLAFLAMPVTLVLLQSLTMNVLQPPMDSNASDEERKQLETTQGVLRFLPLLIGFFSLQVPAGLTIYWFTSNIFTLTQSLSVRAYFAANPPKIELPEYWEQMNSKKDFKDMTPEERRQATEAGLSVGPTFADLITESKFHVFVEREPFRETTEAWQRVESSSKDIKIPDSMQDWVRSSISSLETKNGASGSVDPAIAKVEHAKTNESVTEHAKTSEPVKSQSFAEMEASKTI